MKHTLAVLVLPFALLSSLPVLADAKVEERTKVEFTGMLGKMTRTFGGKAAREGLVQTVALQGDRKARFTEQDGQIIDLGEEKVYTLDLKKKTYTVQTFAELRKQMEDALKQAKENAAQAGEAPPSQPVEWEVDVEVKETGQKKSIAGHDCREVVATITARQKGKTLEQGGGMVLTANQWLAPRIAALDEIAAFDVRYFKQLMGPEFVASAQELASALAMYPQMGELMKKFRGVNWDGTPLLTVTKYESVPDPAAKPREQAAPETGGDDEPPKSLGGLIGKLGQKMAEKKAAQAAAGAGGRATVMTGTTEVLKIAASAAAEDVAIPAGFALK